MTNIDEIYDLFTWDSRLTPEEYRRREQRGLALAKDVRYLYPFLQPFLPEYKSKSVWEPCAKALAARTDGELLPYLPFFFDWLKDPNWPGEEIILNRLAAMPSAATQETLLRCKDEAAREKDSLWLAALRELEERLKGDAAGPEPTGRGKK